MSRIDESSERRTKPGGGRGERGDRAVKGEPKWMKTEWAKDNLYRVGWEWG